MLGTIKPSLHQPDMLPGVLTHPRPLPLPMSAELSLSDGGTYSCEYQVHGQCKVAYKVARLTEGGPLSAKLGCGPLVLKLTQDNDPEPETCEELSRRINAKQSGLKVCPRIYATGVVHEQDRCGHLKQVWFAWFTELAYPLDKYMALPDADRKACLKIALYKQVVVAQHGLLLSDNNLFNCGVIADTGSGVTVAIIDMGSNLPEAHPIKKSTMNDKAMTGWWQKLRWALANPSDADECHSIWTDAANYDLDLVARQVCNTVLRPASSTAEQSAAAGSPITSAPASWDLLANAAANGDSEFDQNSLRWLLDTYVFNKVACLKLLQNGQAIPVGPFERQPPILRLETFIRLTKERRSEVTKDPDEILSFDTVERIIAAWRKNWWSWMLGEETKKKWWDTWGDKREDFEKCRFRTFIFQMCGSRNLLKFWLHVPASYSTLVIFQHCFDVVRTGQGSSNSGEKRHPTRAETLEKFRADRKAMEKALEQVKRLQQPRP